MQRIEPERVFDFEHAELAVRPVGLDEEFSILAEEAGAHAEIIETRIGEIAEHRCVGRMIHRVLVLRRAPEIRLRPMASRAGLAPDKGGCRNGVCLWTGERISDDAASHESQSHADREEGGHYGQRRDPSFRF
ncbi:MAG: hypothetical protein ACXW3S_10420 [Rhodoplanes sp.]